MNRRPTLAAIVAAGLSVVCVALAIGLLGHVQAAPPGPPVARVLFLGNSYTFVGDLPARVREIGQGLTPKVEVQVDSATEGGATLATLYAKADVQQKLAAGRWTHVVLQEQSTEALRDPDAFRRYGGLFATLARDGGAQPVLYQTWARKAGDEVYKYRWSGGSPAAMQQRLDAAYLAEAQDTRSVLARVGDARKRAAEDSALAGIDLYQPDGSHPTMAGTYLGACVMFRVLTGHDPDGGGHPAEVPEGIARRLQAASHDSTRAVPP